jgi:coenzyme F420 hydrogenase subunit beta
MSVPLPALDDAIARVVDNGNCSGCGACVLLDTGLQMRVGDNGYSRPLRVRTSAAGPDAVKRFTSSCPGVVVTAQRPEGAVRHPTMGPVIAAFEAWSSDPETRFRGSSGGTLTSLSAWLIENGEAARMIGAKADAENPRRTVSVQIVTREEALGLAGSRYAPTSSAAQPSALENGTIFVGKPCEVSAIRALSTLKDDGPLLLSFFCAGTPSQKATESLAETLGVPAEEEIKDLWYRGRGWPGRFTVTRVDDTSESTSYDESWGKALGPTVQWRCKICVDGVGESSDVTAADFWRADEHGYPSFSDGAGVSALIARTKRGLDVIERAIAAGVIVARPMNIDELAAVQPLQRDRRTTLVGRLAGTTAAGGSVPRYVGFSLVGLALPRLRDTWRAAKGTFRRRRATSNRDD